MTKHSSHVAALFNGISYDEPERGVAMQYKIVFSDIDGTLLTDKQIVLDSTKRAVQELLLRDIPFVLVSARMPEAILPLAEGMGVEIPIIAYSGALVLLADGEEIANQPMPLLEATKIIAYIEKMYPQALLNFYAGHIWYVRDRSDERVTVEEGVTGVQAVESDYSKLLREGFLPHKLLVIAEPDLCAQMEIELRAQFPTLNIVRSAGHLLEIMGGGISKATGIQAMLQCFGIQASEAIAFGDNYNDLEMFHYVGCAVAMGNAPEDVKHEAQVVTATNNEDGISKFLQKINLVPIET